LRMTATPLSGIRPAVRTPDEPTRAVPDDRFESALRDAFTANPPAGTSRPEIDAPATQRAARSGRDDPWAANQPDLDAPAERDDDRRTAGNRRLDATADRRRRAPTPPRRYDPLDGAGPAIWDGRLFS